jgi:hypothetical protein
MTLRWNARDLAAFARPAALSWLVLAGCGDDGPSRIPYGWGAAGIGGMSASETGGSGGSGGQAGVSGAAIRAAAG